MKRFVLIAFVLPLLAASACKERKFEVTMQRTANGKVQRTLRIWVSDEKKTEPPDIDMVAQAQAAYAGPGGTIPTDTQSVTEHYTCEFGELLPKDLVHKDLTNYGLCVSSTSPMGSILAYGEHLPGQREPLKVAQAGSALIDMTIRALVAYAKDHPDLWGGQVKLARLTAFLEGEFRDDLRNGALLTWQAVVDMGQLDDVTAETTDATEEVAKSVGFAHGVRGLTCAVEHGYLRPAELVQLPEHFPQTIARGMVRKAALAMGYAPDGPFPPGLVKLSDPEEFEGVFEQGLASIGMTKEQFGELGNDADLDFGFSTGTSGTIVWKCKTRPYETNGKWDESAGEVRWQGTARKGCVPPQVLFAVWTEPAEDFQNEHFGKLVLDDDDLLSYTSWRAGLSDPDRAKWDDFIATLHPGPDLLEKLTAFRLPKPPPKPETMPATMPTTAPAEPDRIPERGASLLLNALQPPKD